MFVSIVHLSASASTGPMLQVVLAGSAARAPEPEELGVGLLSPRVLVSTPVFDYNSGLWGVMTDCFEKQSLCIGALGVVLILLNLFDQLGAQEALHLIVKVLFRRHCSSHAKLQGAFASAHN